MRDRSRRSPPRARRRRRWRRSRPRSGRRSRPSASISSCGPSAEPPMPIWRMWRTGPNASASIASISARIRAWRPAARATLSGAPCPRSALCSAARPSVGLTISPANIASRRAARPARSASAGRPSTSASAQMGLGEIEADAAFLDDQPRQPVGLGREQLARAIAVGALSERGPGVFAHVARLSRAARG